MNLPARRSLINGICLAGGRSTRMGRDKALLPHPAGGTFLDHATGLLAKLGLPVFISSSPGQAYPGWPVIRDGVLSKGPACGVLACLRHCQATCAGGILVLACDLPAMSIEPLSRLLRLSTSTSALCAGYSNPASGKIEMGAAYYSRAALPYFQKGFQEGKLGIFSMLPPAGILSLPLPARWEACFLNCNSPEDLRLLGTV